VAMVAMVPREELEAPAKAVQAEALGLLGKEEPEARAEPVKPPA